VIWTPGANYIETSNPFGLAKPPDCFLRDLFTDNPRAVIFPSMHLAVYRFCERVKKTPGILRVVKREPDTQILFDHNLLGITSILPTAFMLEGGWSGRLRQRLQDMRIERFGGTADKLCDHLEMKEQEKELQQEAAMQDELDRRNTSSFFANQVRDGHLVFITGYDTAPPEARDVPAPSPVTHVKGRTADSAASA
jgi:hypothetical protein